MSIHNCDKDRVVIEVGQGCPRGYSFTILQNEQPMDLTKYNVKLQIKYEPYYILDPLLEKIITLNSDINTIGQITDPTNGVFQVQMTLEDTLKLPLGDYALVILLEEGGVVTNISGDGNEYAIFRVCYQ